MSAHELLSNDQMRRADALTIASGIPGIDLMENAGAAVANVAGDCARVMGAPRIAVLCGPGNNGGDGFVAARLLRDQGFDVTAALLGDPGALKGDAAEAARRFKSPPAPAAGFDLGRTDLVIDALFGAGLARDIDGEARTLIEAVNAWSSGRKPVVAVDVPSGVDGDTGAVRGVAVRASDTVTFFRFKPGHLLLPGRRLCGDLHISDIGIRASVLEAIAPTSFANAPALWRSSLPQPRVEGHKYSRGHALVVSGGAWTSGAARLSARGALRGGAGLVTLASPRAAHAVNAARIDAVMIRPCDSPDDLARILSDHRFNAVVMGPGLGVDDATAELVGAALRAGADGRSLVLDADALTAYADRAPTLAARIRASGMNVVITPHEGEFSRLFDQPGDKLTRARRAASVLGATVLLKGPDTVVANPNGRASIAFDASPWLATAGSGDVLAGIVAALLAQGMAPFEAASAAVFMHADAARRFGPGLISEDLPEQLPRVWRELLSC